MKERTQAFYGRLGGLGREPRADHVLMSRAIQICGTWRTHFAWHLTMALRDVGAWP